MALGKKGGAVEGAFSRSGEPAEIIRPHPNVLVDLEFTLNFLRSNDRGALVVCGVREAPYGTTRLCFQLNCTIYCGCMSVSVGNFGLARIRPDMCCLKQTATHRTWQRLAVFSGHVPGVYSFSPGTFQTGAVTHLALTYPAFRQVLLLRICLWAAPSHYFGVDANEALAV